MHKLEFLELFDAATRAAKSASKRISGNNSPEVSRCVDAMNRLKKAPEYLPNQVISTTPIGSYYNVLVDHKNPRIRSEARALWDLWLTYLYATGTKQSKGRNQEPAKKPDGIKTGDSKRDKVREILQTSLSKVANEVVDVEIKKLVVSCDPSIVAASVESAMFKKFGYFGGRGKAEYRSIMFNMGDSNNPDLKRRVLIGEIDGERLVTMEKEEMGSDKIQMEVRNIKEKARFREDNRIKKMLETDMVMT
ncbi:unnamed protein product [Cochlearia groenlandica]